MLLTLVISTVAGWLCGSAFWYGVHTGERAEDNRLVGAWQHSAAVWPLFPIYLLGFRYGVWRRERELAPERMRQKLMEEQAQKAQNVAQFPSAWWPPAGYQQQPIWPGSVTFPGTGSTP